MGSAQQHQSVPFAMVLFRTSGTNWFAADAIRFARPVVKADADNRFAVVAIDTKSGLPWNCVPLPSGCCYPILWI
ncbi:MAG: hypothetical protein JWP89_4227 [Schlesneria sp.]|nr:hypothetical protein [Schlesneria sp.]